MQVVLVAMEDVLENFGEIFDNLFVDKEGQNFLVDVEEISGSSFLVSNKLEMFCLLLGRLLTNKHSCKVCDSIYRTKVK